MLQIASFSSFGDKVLAFRPLSLETRVVSLYISAAATMYQYLIIICCCIFIFLLSSPTSSTVFLSSCCLLLPLAHTVGITNW